MKQKVYIDGKLTEPIPSNEEVRELVRQGHRVIAVDEANIAVEITPELLKPK